MGWRMIESLASQLQSIRAFSKSNEEIIVLKINISKEYSKCEGPHLDISSIQRGYYKGNKGDDLERPIPEDLLQTGGPCNKAINSSATLQHRILEENK